MHAERGMVRGLQRRGQDVRVTATSVAVRCRGRGGVVRLGNECGEDVTAALLSVDCGDDGAGPLEAAGRHLEVVVRVNVLKQCWEGLEPVLRHPATEEKVGDDVPCLRRRRNGDGKGG